MQYLSSCVRIFSFGNRLLQVAGLPVCKGQIILQCIKVDGL